MVRRPRPKTQIVWDNPDQQPALQTLAAALGIYLPNVPNAQIGNVTRLILNLADATIEYGPDQMAALLEPIINRHC